jgi:protein-S-isoprenylcysteine O-methyltransferase Ste14
MLLALAIVIGTFPFYLAAGAYFMVINCVFCPYEERKLAEAFAAEYLVYKNKVRRWI